MKSGIVFLASKYNDSLLAFANDIAVYRDFDVFVIIDDNSIYHGKSFQNVKLIQVPDEMCLTTGYCNSNISNNSTHIKKNPIALDKFLYFFCEKYVTYEFLWVFEDDVFIPDYTVLTSLQEKYYEYDLVTPNNFKKVDKALDWHWRSVIEKHPAPYYYSMVCAMGVSRKMLNAVKEYVGINNSLFYCEVMFNTLAFHKELKVKDAIEFKSVVWIGRWELDEFLLLPNNVFHPRKDIDNHENLRKEIQQAKKDGYTPIDNLPYFVKL